MRKEYPIPPCTGLRIDVKAGQHIAVIDPEGGQVADFFAQGAENPGEFLSPGVTIDCNASLRLHIGDILYSNLYRPMLELLADDVGEHDLLHPCCCKEMYDFFYHNGEGHPNCLDNINGALGQSNPTITPVNLFMHTKIHSDGSISVEKPLSRAGDKIVFRARMDMALGIAACSVRESKCNSGACTPIHVVIDSGEEA